MATELFVGNLDRSITNDDLRDAFSAHGEVQRATVITDKETRQSKGFGFVAFADESQAQAAIAAMNGQILGSKPLSVNEARGKTEGGGGNARGQGGGKPRFGGRGGERGGRGFAPRQELAPGVKELFVGGLDFSVSDAELRDMFSQYGTVLKAKVMMDRTSGESRGFGFVQLSSSEENQAAIDALHGQASGSRTLEVNEARERAAAPQRRFSRY